MAKSDIYQDVISSYLWGSPVYTPSTAVDAVGTMVGAIGNGGTVNDWKRWIPGVGKYNVIRSRRKQHKRLGGDSAGNRIASEQLGAITANIAPAVLLGIAGGFAGSAIGHVTGVGRHSGFATGLGLGTAGGALLGPIIGAIAAAAKKTRTDEEQAAYERSGALANYLVPGLAHYNSFKSFGNQYAYENAQEEQEDQKKAASFNKRADGGIVNDAIGSAVGSTLLPGSGIVGSIHGALSGKPTEEELEEMDKHPGRSYIPGVGASRLIRKQLDTINTKHPGITALSEKIGPFTSSLLISAALAAGGAGIGSLLGAKYLTRQGVPVDIGAGDTIAVGGNTADSAALQGIALGALGGALGGAAIGSATNVLAAVIAAARKRRTQLEQEKADKDSSVLANLLVPGKAMYDRTRRLSSLTRREDARNAKAEQA